MSYIILVGIGFMVLCLFLYRGLKEEGSGGDDVIQAPIDKAPQQAKPKPAKPAVKQKATARPAPAKKPQETANDDLTRIEGVGPKIATLLTDAGIHTFKQLAALDAAALKRIVTDGGVRFREKVAVTWSEQAKLAARGQWDALAKRQARMKGGTR